MSDKRYYYNKNGGLIQTIFDDLDIDEIQLMKRNFIGVIELMKENFTYVVNEQQNRYTSQAF